MQNKDRYDGLKARELRAICKEKGCDVTGIMKTVDIKEALLKFEATQMTEEAKSMVNTGTEDGHLITIFIPFGEENDNEAVQWLKRTLDSLKEQKCDIVVCNIKNVYSKNITIDICKEYGIKCYEKFEMSGNSIVKLLHYAVSFAETPFIGFARVGAEYESDCIEKAIEAVSVENLVQGHYSNDEDKQKRKDALQCMSTLTFQYVGGFDVRCTGTKLTYLEFYQYCRRREIEVVEIENVGKLGYQQSFTSQNSNKDFNRLMVGAKDRKYDKDIVPNNVFPTGQEGTS